MSRIDRRIWRMGNPIHLQFGSIEAEEEDLSTKECSECNRPLGVRHGTIHARWSLEGRRPKQFGTFTWGADRPLIVGSVGRALRRQFTGVRLRRVQFHGRVRLPGDDDLVDLDARHTVDAMQQSTIKRGVACPSCGSQRLDLLGVEDTKYVRRNGKPFPTVIPRKSGHGLFVDAAVVDALGYFDWDDRPYCTSEFKAAVEALGATNVHFAEWGEVVRR